jgi:hypothetical protein
MFVGRIVEGHRDLAWADVARRSSTVATCGGVVSLFLKVSSLHDYFLMVVF